MIKALPSKINVSKVITYDVEPIVYEIAKYEEKQPSEVTLKEVMDWIDDWISEDFNLEGVTTQQARELIIRDENGTELDY